MSEPKKEATTKQILAEVEAGTPVTQIASKLDIDRTTVWRHLKEAAIEFRRGNQEALGELVAKLVDEYFSNYDGVGAGTLDPEGRGTHEDSRLDRKANRRERRISRRRRTRLGNC